MKFTVTQYGNKKEILKFPDHYVTLAITVDDTGVVANEEGKKIVPAGTILGGGIIQDQSKLAIKANDATAEGVLFNDTDVTYGPASGALLIHGFIDSSKLPEVPSAEAKETLKQITFIV